MNRRGFLALTGAAAVFPRIAFAEATSKLPRLALVASAIPASEMVIGGDINWSGWVEQMSVHGFVEGRTIKYERYLVPNDRAAELVPPILASAPDAIFWGGARAAARLAVDLNHTIPMIAHQADVLGSGLVSNVAHPGGNITGISLDAGADAPGKILGLLAETVPQAKKFAYVAPGSHGQMLVTEQVAFNVVRAAAAKLGVSVQPILYTDGDLSEANFAKVFDTITSQGIEAAQFAQTQTVLTAEAIEITARLARAAKLPTISPFGAFADGGGLLAYGVDVPYQCRQAADYVAMILSGTNPGDLPILQATVYEFKLNQKTAKAIGVTVPTSILVQASRLIV